MQQASWWPCWAGMVVAILAVCVENCRELKGDNVLMEPQQVKFLSAVVTEAGVVEREAKADVEEEEVALWTRGALEKAWEAERAALAVWEDIQYYGQVGLSWF